MQPDQTLPSSVALGQPDMALFGAAERAFNGAVSIVIDSPLMLQAAAEDLRKIKGIASDLESARTGLKKPILEAGRAIDAFFKRPLTFCADAETKLKGGILTWNQEQQRKARDEQARRDEEARRERERLQVQASQLEAEGRHDEAESKLQLADVVTAPVVQMAAAPAGLSTRKVWKADVTDPQALLRYLADHPEFEHFVSIELGAITKYAQATSGRVAVPGVAFRQEEQLAARAA
jgi:hypothetical protein